MNVHEKSKNGYACFFFIWQAVFGIAVYIGHAVFGIAVFLAAVAEIITFLTNSPNVVVESIINAFKPIPAQQPTPAPQCARYDYQRRDGECDKLEELSHQLLCRITIQPLEKVCVEFKR